MSAMEEELLSLRAQVAEQADQIRRLERALMDAPIARPDGQSPAEVALRARQSRWATVHQVALKSVADSVKRQREVRVRMRVKTVRDRMQTLIRRAEMGDPTVPIDLNRHLYRMLETELSKI